MDKITYISKSVLENASWDMHCLLVRVRNVPMNATTSGFRNSQLFQDIRDLLDLIERESDDKKDNGKPI